MTHPLRIEKLQRGHAIDSFDCSHEALNGSLIRYALQNQQAEASQTYVAPSEGKVASYYTLVVGKVEYDDVPIPHHVNCPSGGRPQVGRARVSAPVS